MLWLLATNDDDDAIDDENGDVFCSLTDSENICLTLLTSPGHPAKMLGCMPDRLNREPVNSLIGFQAAPADSDVLIDDLAAD